MISCQSFGKVFRCSRFVLMSGSEKLSLSMRQSTSRRFALIIQAFSFSRCNQLNSFFRSKGWECAWERSNRLCTRTARKWTRNSFFPFASHRQGRGVAKEKIPSSLSHSNNLNSQDPSPKTPETTKKNTARSLRLLPTQKTQTTQKKKLARIGRSHRNYLETELPRGPLFLPPKAKA